MEKITGVYLVNLVLVGLLIYISSWFIKRTMENVLEKSKLVPEKGKQTVLNVTHHGLNALGIVIFILYALSPFVQFDKILAGAGIIGIVIGFASQSLLRDLLAGFFRISTKQLHKGDLVIVNGKLRGRVEEIGMMYLQIRQYDGKLITINNGEVKDIQNFNVDKMRAVVDVVVSFRENPQKVMKALEEVCEKLNQQHSEYLLRGTEEQPFQVYGLTSTNEQFFGYRYTVVALVKDEVYFQAMNTIRLEVAQAMFDSRIQMAEQNIYFKTRAELNKREDSY